MAKAKTLMASAIITAFFAPAIVAAQEVVEVEEFPFVSDMTNPDAEVDLNKEQVKDQIIDYEEMPAPFTTAVQFNGREGIAYMTANGRFVLRGVIFDLWSNKTIQTMEELREAKTNVNIEDLGFAKEDVDPFIYGTGPAKVTAFVDPLCPHCGNLFDQLRSDPSYAKDYTFTFYTVPFLGDNSVRAVSILSCHEDREEAIAKMLSKDMRWYAKTQVPEGCDPQPIMNRTLLSQTLGVTGVPYIIGPNGGIARGMPADLRGFLANG